MTRMAISAPEPEDEQMEDNILPNEGEFFGVPQEPVSRQRGRDSEKAKVMAEKPLLEDAIKRFEARIKHYESIYSVPEDDIANPERFMRRIEANKLHVQDLTDEKEFLQSLLDNA